ncbi:MAG: HAMP domain-containing sensor histidine kinase [Verrucomicrobiota bacterium]
MQQVLALGLDAPRMTQYLAHVRGVVTYAVPQLAWMFIHDGTGGMLVSCASVKMVPEAGQNVEAIGRVAAGLFAPFIERGVTKRIGAGEFPEAKAVEAKDLLEKEAFAQFVRVRGYVRDVALGWGNLTVLFSGNGQPFKAVIAVPPEFRLPRDWLEAEMEVAGVCWTREDYEGRPAVINLYSARTNMFILLRPGTSNLFERPHCTIQSLIEDPVRPGQRVRVSGVVTAHQPGGRIYIQDATGPAHVQPLQLLYKGDPKGEYLEHPEQSVPHIGDQIEIIGAPVLSPRAPGFVDAEYRISGHGPIVTPKSVTVADLMSGGFDAQLVTLRARLVDFETRGSRTRTTEVLILSAADHFFEARWENSNPDALSLEPNTSVQVTGIALVRMGEWQRRRSFQILLRGPEDVRVLGPLPLWHRPEIMRPLALAGVVAAIPMSWILLLRRQVRQRTAEVVTMNDQLRHEIRERVRAEEQVARALETERELNRLKSNFVSMVSHEFRTPLGNIQSSTELLANYYDRLPPERRAALLNNIVSCTSGMAEMMEEVLLLSRVEARDYERHLEPIALDDLCLRIRDEVQSATHQRCPIELELESERRQCHADTTLLRHIFINLLTNAVKYSPPGATVGFRLSRNGILAVFEINDQGIGIPDAEMNRLFHAFFRGSNTAHAPGTGLGLVIVKRCVELHGGTIAIDSRMDKGTRVTVRLPLFQEAPQLAPSETEEAHR